MTSRTSRTPSRRMRTIFRSEVLVRTLVVTGAMVAPVAAGAQQERHAAVASAAQRPAARPGRVHLVLPGETLWSLAQRYLGDGHRWKEIVALNRNRVSSARALEAGTTLSIPDRGTVALPSNVANGVAAMPAGGVAVDSRSPFEGRTVFFAARRSSLAGAASNSSADSAPGTRHVAASPDASPASAVGSTRPSLAREIVGAPWIAADDDVVGAGAVTRRLEIMAIVAQEGAQELHLYDRVAVRMPRAVRPVVGRELLAVSTTRVDGVGLAIIPVGAVRLTALDTAAVESVALARVIAKYGSMEEGVLLVPFPEGGAGRTALTSTDGPANRDGAGGAPMRANGTIVSVMDGALLPTLQHVVLVDVGDGAGARSGAVVTFYRDEASRAEGRATDAIARGTVLRASARGASVLIVQQSQPALREGTPLRIEPASR